MKKYKWLLFDADGTLFDYQKAESESFKKTLLMNNLDFKEEYLLRYKSINGALWKLLENGEITAEKLKYRRFELLAEQFNLNADGKKLSADYLKNLSECAYLIDSALEVLTELKKQHGIAIITNGLTEVQRPRFANSAISHLFDAIVISDEEGTAKPEPAIFDIIFQRMGNPNKSEVLIIGDSLSSDMKGGIDYGIDTCWANFLFRDFIPDLKVNYQISHLKELIPLLT